MSQRFLIVTVLALLFTINLSSQAELPKIAPLSPETANIAKFSEVPVSYYTGVPNISIPITNLTGRSTSIPVSLSYHAGGHKVSDIASWVGLGWNLNTGGQIFRVMRQLPDDFSNGYINVSDGKKVQDFLGDDFSGKAQKINTAVHGNAADYAPDEFNFSFMGVSGKFMFNQNRSPDAPYGEIIMFPKSDIIVEPTMDANGQFLEWKITNTDGTQYIFGGITESAQRATDRITSTTSYSAGQNSLPADGPDPYTFAYDTSWKLTRIITSTNDIVSFDYEPISYTNDCIPTGESDITRNGGNGYSRSSTQTSGTNYVIKRITTINGSVEFFRESNYREDLFYDQALDYIIVSNNHSQQIQRIDLIHDYFESPIPAQQFFICDGIRENAQDENGSYIFNQEISKRLRLDEVRFYNNDDSSYYKYELEYNEDIILPHRLSKAQDYWGFYNGKENNTTLIPDMFFSDPKDEANSNVEEQLFYYNGANRTINTSFTQANMLKKIHYPEGGFTEFAYENNTASESHAYLGSDNIFEPYEDHFVSIYTEDSAASIVQVNVGGSFKDAYVTNFTIESPVAQKGRFIYESSSSIWDNTDEGASLGFEHGDIRFYIREVNNDIVGDIVGLPNGIPIGSDSEIYLEPGDYQLQLVFYAVDGVGSVNNPPFDPTDHDIWVSLGWKTRLFPHKTIGGLRIKSIKDYSGYEYTTEPSTPTPILAKHRAYEYIRLDDGDQSGWIAGVPVFKQVTVLTDVFEYDFDLGTYYEHRHRNKISSNNVMPLITTQSNYVGYTNVIESIIDHETNPQIVPNTANDVQIKKSYSFNTALLLGTYLGAPTVGDWKSGNLIESKYFKKLNPENPDGSGILQPTNLPTLFNYFPIKIESTNNINVGASYIESVSGIDVFQKSYTYPSNGNLLDPTWAYVSNISHLVEMPQEYILNSGRTRVENTSSEDLFYDENDLYKKSISTNSSFGYGINHLNPISKEIVNSEGEILTQRFINVLDLASFNEEHQLLINQNKIDIPINTNSFKIKDSNQILLGSQETEYVILYNDNLVLPKKIKTAKTGNVPEERIVYNDYDQYGNPLSISQANGENIYYIWGYNQSKPIAKIINARYVHVQNVTANLQTLSNQDGDSTVDYYDSTTGTTLPNGSEGLLRQALNNLRSNSNFLQSQIWTYTYDPLIGVTSITDPRGYVIYYKYDEFNRLQQVIDKNQNILSENEYNYANQN